MEHTEKQEQERKLIALWTVLLAAIIVFGSLLVYLNIRVEWRIEILSELLVKNQEELKRYQQSQKQYNSRLKDFYQSLKIFLERFESERETVKKRIEGENTHKEKELPEVQNQERGEEVLPPVSIKNRVLSAALEKEIPTTFVQRFWPEFFKYETSDIDTLWDISEHFYGHGRYYPVLLAMNPEVDIFTIQAGQRLKILKDRKDVNKVYRQFVEKKDHALYFWYQIQEGDTPERLSRKFYKTEDMYPLIQQANPGFSLESGPKIRILLDEDL